MDAFKYVMMSSVQGLSRDPLLVRIPPVYAGGGGHTRRRVGCRDGRGAAGTGLYPASYFRGWLGLDSVGQPREPAWSVLPSCAPQGAREQRYRFIKTHQWLLEGYSWGVLEQVLEEKASGRDLQVPEVGQVRAEVEGGRQGAPRTSSIPPPRYLIRTITFSQYYIKCCTKAAVGRVPYCLFNHVAWPCAPFSIQIREQWPIHQESLKRVAKYGCHEAKLNWSVGRARK